MDLFNCIDFFSISYYSGCALIQNKDVYKPLYIQEASLVRHGLGHHAVSLHCLHGK